MFLLIYICARIIPLTVMYSFTLGKPSQKQWLTQDAWGAEVVTKRAPAHRKLWCIYSKMNWMGNLEGTFVGGGEVNVVKSVCDQRQTLRKPFGARCFSENLGVQSKSKTPVTIGFTFRMTWKLLKHRNTMFTCRWMLSWLYIDIFEMTMMIIYLLFRKKP